MRLRKPRIEDYTFVYECYQDWPLTEKGPVTLQKAIDWTRRWIHRTDEICLVAELGGPVGLIMYQRGSFPLDEACVIHNIVVHPKHRRKGYANRIEKVLKERLVSEGVKCAWFNALPGPIARQTEKGKFRKVGEIMGETGRLVVGEVTPDMEL